MEDKPSIMTSYEYFLYKIQLDIIENICYFSQAGGRAQPPV